MAFTLICHICGQQLTLFDSAIKKRRGVIRCTSCGNRISYDLDARKIQKSGFWSQKESSFDNRGKNRLLSQIKRENHRLSDNMAPAQNTSPPPQSQNPFPQLHKQSHRLDKSDQNHKIAPHQNDRRRLISVPIYTAKPNPVKSPAVTRWKRLISKIKSWFPLH